MPMIRIGRILLGLALVVVFGTSITAQNDDVPRYVPLDECFIPLPEGVDYECGFVVVQEFHDGRTDNTLELGVVRLLTGADEPEAPVFFGAGGPGGSVIPWAQAAAGQALSDPTSAYGQLLETRDLVYFAQRGTQFSEPFLTCPEEQAVDPAQAVGQTFDEHLRAQLDLLEQCHDRIISEGVNLDAFNSLENAADVNAIRQSIGYEQIVFYGESYGTILAQHVMRDFPGILESVILDGTASLSITDWEEDMVRKFQIVLDRVVSLCNDSPLCTEAYPNFADDLNAVYAQAETNPLEVSIFVEGEQLAVPVTVDVLSSTLYTNLYSVDSIGLFPLAIDQMVNGEMTTFQQFFNLANSAFSESGTMMHYAVVCAEDPVTTPVEETLPEGPVFDIVVEHAREGFLGYQAICDLVDVTPIEEDDENVTNDLPVLVLNGALDPATPNFRSDEVADALPNSFTYDFPYGSHVQVPGSECAAGIMAEFIADPTVPPDGSCIDEIEPITFELPQPTLEDVIGLTFNLQSYSLGEERADYEGEATYSVVFAEDTLTFQADCNTVTATYTINEDLTAEVELGASTLAECGPESLSEAFTSILGETELIIFSISRDGVISANFLALESGQSMFLSAE